jgi:hypothetical protein
LRAQQEQHNTIAEYRLQLLQHIIAALNYAGVTTKERSQLFQADVDIANRLTGKRPLRIFFRPVANSEFFKTILKGLKHSG